MTTRDEVKKACEHADDLKSNFLTQHGWKYTSGTPTCCWFWQKKLPDGRIVLTDAGTAIEFEDALNTDMQEVPGEDA